MYIWTINVIIEAMEKIELKVRRNTKGDKWVHFLERDGKVVYKSAPTHKKYVAILFNQEFHPVCRWGSIQRVGSGDFMYQYEAHVFPYLAVSDEPGVANLIHIPAKKAFKYYSAESKAYGYCHTYATSEEEAIDKMASNLSRCRGWLRPTKYTAKKELEKLGIKEHPQHAIGF